MSKSILLSCLVYLFTCIVTVSSLTCHVCDSEASCLDDVIQECPNHTSCYSIFDQNSVTARGCSKTCLTHSEDQYCILCGEDECNSENNIRLEILKIVLDFGEDENDNNNRMVKRRIKMRNVNFDKLWNSIKKFFKWLSRASEAVNFADDVHTLTVNGKRESWRTSMERDEALQRISDLENAIRELLERDLERTTTKPEVKKIKILPKYHPSNHYLTRDSNLLIFLSPVLLVLFFYIV